MSCDYSKAYFVTYPQPKFSKLKHLGPLKIKKPLGSVSVNHLCSMHTHVGGESAIAVQAEKSDNVDGL